MSVYYIYINFLFGVPNWEASNTDNNPVACGPLVLSPLSEIYGRLYIYWGSNIAFVCFTIGCALAPSFDSLIVFRFLAGCAGATGQTVGGGTVGDLFVQIERGLPMSLYTLGPVIGPAIGPVGGGFLAQAMGWRWVFYLITMLGGVTMVVPPSLILQLLLTRPDRDISIHARNIRPHNPRTQNRPSYRRNWKPKPPLKTPPQYLSHRIPAPLPYPSPQAPPHVTNRNYPLSIHGHDLRISLLTLYHVPIRLRRPLRLHYWHDRIVLYRHRSRMFSRDGDHGIYYGPYYGAFVEKWREEAGIQTSSHDSRRVCDTDCVGLVWVVC